MEVQKSTESFSGVNADCVRRGFAEKPSEQVDAIHDYGAAPAFLSCGLLADDAGLAANDYNGSGSRGGDRCNDGSTSDVLQSFMEKMDSSGMIDAYLASHGSAIDVMPLGNVSDEGRVVCGAKGDDVDERSFDRAVLLRGQLAFSRNTSSSGFYSKEDTEVSEYLDFGNETNELSMKEKGLSWDSLIETPLRSDESVFSPVQDISRSLQEFTIDRGLDAEFDSRAIFGSRLTFDSTDLSSAEHASEIGMGIPTGAVPPPPLPPPLPPPPLLASATPATHNVEDSSAGLDPALVAFLQDSLSKGSDGKFTWKTSEHMQTFMSMFRVGSSPVRPASVPEDRRRLVVARRGLSFGPEEAMVASPSSVASTITSHASFLSQLSPISEQSRQDTEERILPSFPPPVSSGLSDLALAAYCWLKKSGKVSRAVLRAGFLPDQIYAGHVTVEREANLVSLVAEQYADVAKAWSGPAKGRDSYDFKLALRKTFRKYGETKVEQVNNGAGRKFILCEKVSQGILEEMENRAKRPDDRGLPDLPSGAHQAMGNGVHFGGESNLRALLARSSFPESRWHDCSDKSWYKKRNIPYKVKPSPRPKRSKNA